MECNFMGSQTGRKAPQTQTMEIIYINNVILEEKVN